MCSGGARKRLAPGLLAVLAAWRMTRSMLFVIDKIQRVMTSGNRDDRVGQTRDEGELGELGTAIDNMLDSLPACGRRWSESERCRS